MARGIEIQITEVLSKTLLKDKIYQILKTQLLEGVFKPKEQLSASKIAAQLGVSKTPVNQAIHRLELEGLVYFSSNQRYYVHSDSRKNIEEMSAIRLLLESYAGKLATSKMSAGQIDQLEKINGKIFEQLTNFKQAKNPQKFIEGFISLNKEFHDLITNSCGNERLTKMTRDSRERLVVFNLIRYLTFEDFHVSFNDHKVLIDALKEKNGDRVEAILKEHIDRTMTTLLSRMHGRDSSPDPSSR